MTIELGTLDSTFDDNKLGIDDELTLGIPLDMRLRETDGIALSTDEGTSDEEVVGISDGIELSDTDDNVFGVKDGLVLGISLYIMLGTDDGFFDGEAL